MLSHWINFEFLAILNLFILLLWPTSSEYTTTKNGVVGTILRILTIIAIILDIVFIVLKAIA